MFENIGSAELLVVLIIVLIFFGPKRIPELARSFGKGLRKFNDAKQGFESQVKTAMKEPMDSINEARQNLERSLKETGDPIKQMLSEPVIPSHDTPRLKPPEQSLPRGARLDIENEEAQTKQIAITPPPKGDPEPKDPTSPNTPL